MKDEYSGNAEMICPVCNSKIFEYDDENLKGFIKCLRCNKIYSRNALLKANKKNIPVEVNQIKNKVASKFVNDFKKILKKNVGYNKKFK